MKKYYYLKLAIVNIITISRLIGACILPLIYFKHGIESLTISVIIIFLTDLVDGKLSRLFKVETFLGSLLDVVSDKLLAFVLIAILTYYYPSMLIVLVLEFSIFVLNTLTFKDNKNIKSSLLGKVKTMVLDISISLMFILLTKDLYVNYLPYLISNFITKNLSAISYILIGIMIGMQIITISDYRKKNIKETTYEKVVFKDILPFKEIIFRITSRDFYIKNKDKKIKELLYNK